MAQLETSPPLGTVLRDLRIERGMRQAELARAVHCHPKTIFRIESGRRSPSDVLLRRIARELDHDYAALRRAKAEKAAA